MSTPMTPTATSAFVFEKEKLAAKLAEVKKEILTYTGKHNHNPFLWINKNIDPLEKAIFVGDKSKELSDKILALKAEAPIVNKNISVPEAGNIQQEPTNKIPEPKGLTLPKEQKNK